MQQAGHGEGWVCVCVCVCVCGGGGCCCCCLWGEGTAVRKRVGWGAKGTVEKKETQWRGWGGQWVPKGLKTNDFSCHRIGEWPCTQELSLMFSPNPDMLQIQFLFRNAIFCPMILESKSRQSAEEPITWDNTTTSCNENQHNWHQQHNFTVQDICQGCTDQNHHHHQNIFFF